MYAFIVVSFLAFVVMVYLRTKKVMRYQKLTKNIPEEKGVPIFGILFKFGTSGTEMLHSLDEMMTKNGSNIAKTWFGPNFAIAISSPEIIGEILSNNKLIDKPFLYNFFVPCIEQSVLFLSNGDSWRKQRKMLSPSFHFQLFRDYLNVFNSNSRSYIENLKGEIGKTGFNVWNYSNMCALTIATENMTGVKVNVLEKGREEIVKAFRYLEYAFTYRGMRPWLYPDATFFLTEVGKKSKQSLNILHDFLDEILSQRKKRQNNDVNSLESEHSDTDSRLNNEINNSKKFLEILLEHKDNGRMTRKEFLDEMLTMIIVGYSTVAVTMSYAMYCLMKNQDVQEKVVNELNDIFNGSDREATMEDLQKMVYTEKVLKETSRLFTAVPFFAREVKEDAYLKSGYTLPKGAFIFIFPYHMHRRADLFPNPEVFDPERFNEENTSSRNPYAFIPFSGGSRICLGHKYAMLEGKVLLSTILRSYKILPPTDDSPDIKLAHGMVLHSTTGVHIRIENRKEKK